MHLVRLLLSGIHALRHGDILVDVDEHRDELLRIRSGALAFSEVQARALELNRVFEEAFPGLFRDLHRWLPTGQATELVRAVEYFGGHATGAPIFGLVSYLTIGLILLLAATYALGHRHSRPSG